MIFSLFDGIPRLLLILSEIVVEILHIFFQHVFRPLQSFLVQLRQLFKLVYLLSFVVDQHLEEQRLSLLCDEVVYRLIDFHPVFYGVLGRLYETLLGLIVRLFFIFFAQFVQLSNCYFLFFDALFPNLELVILLLLFSFSFFLLFFHPKNLHNEMYTSASSGIEKGLSYFITFLDAILGKLPVLSY